MYSITSRQNNSYVFENENGGIFTVNDYVNLTGLVADNEQFPTIKLSSQSNKSPFCPNYTNNTWTTSNSSAKSKALDMSRMVEWAAMVQDCLAKTNKGSVAFPLKSNNSDSAHYYLVEIKKNGELIISNPSKTANNALDFTILYPAYILQKLVFDAQFYAMCNNGAEHYRKGKNTEIYENKINTLVSTQIDNEIFDRNTGVKYNAVAQVKQGTNILHQSLNQGCNDTVVLNILAINKFTPLKEDGIGAPVIDALRYFVQKKGIQLEKNNRVLLCNEPDKLGDYIKQGYDLTEEGALTFRIMYAAAWFARSTTVDTEEGARSIVFIGVLQDTVIAEPEQLYEFLGVTQKFVVDTFFNDNVINQNNNNNVVVHTIQEVDEETKTIAPAPKPQPQQLPLPQPQSRITHNVAEEKVEQLSYEAIAKMLLAASTGNKNVRKNIINQHLHTREDCTEVMKYLESKALLSFEVQEKRSSLQNTVAKSANKPANKPTVKPVINTEAKIEDEVKVPYIKPFAPQVNTNNNNAPAEVKVPSNNVPFIKPFTPNKNTTEEKKPAKPINSNPVAEDKVVNNSETKVVDLAMRIKTELMNQAQMIQEMLRVGGLDQNGIDDVRSFIKKSVDAGLDSGWLKRTVSSAPQHIKDYCDFEINHKKVMTIMMNTLTTQKALNDDEFQNIKDFINNAVSHNYAIDDIKTFAQANQSRVMKHIDTAEALKARHDQIYDNLMHHMGTTAPLNNTEVNDVQKFINSAENVGYDVEDIYTALGSVSGHH